MRGTPAHLACAGGGEHLRGAEGVGDGAHCGAGLLQRDAARGAAPAGGLAGGSARSTMRGDPPFTP